MNHRLLTRIQVAPLGLVLLCASCSSTGARGAAEGAAVGAAAGAVGGLLSAAIFGGDPAAAAGRGAAFGAGSGAVTGGIRGEQQHAAAEERRRAEEEAQRQAELDKLKSDIGEDAYQGLVALTERKHEVAIAYARTSARSPQREFALAGLWLEALAYADSQRGSDAEALLQRIVAADPETHSDAQARETLDELLQSLQEIRTEYGIS